MKNLLRLGGIGVALLALLTIVRAGPFTSPRGDDVLLKRLDRDGDGRISAAELPRAAWMSRIDQDGDGFASFEEGRAALRRLRQQGQKLPTELTAPPTPDTPPPPAQGRQVDRYADTPQWLPADDFGVGTQISDVELKSLDGATIHLGDLMGKSGLVLGLFSPDCPLSRKLAPEMKRLSSDLARSGIATTWVCVPGADRSAEARAFAAEYQLDPRSLHLDPDGHFAQSADAATTTEAFLLDATRTLIYRGAINDQYGVGSVRSSTVHAYLRDAADALLAGRTPDIAATTAPGCALDLPRSSRVAHADAPTYHGRISRILQTHCVECHRQGGIAPFALDQLSDVLDNAGMIRRQVERGKMPPWFADPAQSGAHAVFRNDRSLPEADRQALLAWLASDRPVGDASTAPAPRSFAEDWQIGTPDAVYQIPQPFAVKAEGSIPYQYAVVETGLSEDRWVRGYEIQPTARAAVHHVIVQVFGPDEKVRRVGEGRGGFWAAYVPGNSHRLYDPGQARLLPKGARLQFQIHYTATGKATTDQVQIGVLFADAAPEFEVRVASLANPRIRIPAGAAAHEETLELPLSQEYWVTGYMPHLHTRGAAFRYEVAYPGGQRETLLNVPHYDFNWQLQYQTVEPKHLPAGSRLKVTAIYDNSAANPANPDPTRDVRWGPQTWDEMMIGYIEHIVKRDDKDVAQR